MTVTTDDLEPTEDEAVDAEWEAPPSELAPDVDHELADLDDREVVVSAFAGIGGIDLGLERAGYQTGVQIEWDAAASRVLAARFPRAARYGDVRKVDGESVRRSIGGRPVKILGGGFPCQDLSVAGRRAGMAGERSGLYGELLRLATQLDPDWLVVENVPGLLSADADPEANDGAGYGPGSGFALFLGDLTGYRPPVPDPGWRNSGVCHGPLGTAAWRMLDARHFGVAQRRRRVFVVFHPRDRRAPAAVLLEPEGVRWDPAARRPSWAGAADAAVGAPVRGGPGGPVGAGEGDVGTPVVANALTRNGLGGGGPDDNLAQGNHLVPLAADVRNGLLDGEVTGTLQSHGESYSLNAQPMIVDGREEAQGFQYPDGKFGLEDYAPGRDVPSGQSFGNAVGVGDGQVTPPLKSSSGGGSSSHTFVADEPRPVGHVEASGGKPGQGYQAIVDGREQGGDTYNGDVTGDVTHTVRANAGPEGIPVVVPGRPGGPLEASGGEDLAPTVTSKWAKGRGGPAGSETGNLVTQPAAMRETGQGFWTEDDVAGSLRAQPTHHGDTVVTVVGDGGSDVSHPVTASGTDGMGRGVPAVAFRTDQSFAAAESVTGQITHALTAEGADASEDGTGRGTPIVAVPEVAAPLTAGSHSPGVSAPGRRQEDDHNVVGYYRKAQKAHHPDDHERWEADDVTDTLDASGHAARTASAVVEPVSTWAIEPETGQGADLRARATDVSPALTATDLARSTDRGVRAATHAAVRRLTPRECERLQGFPDDWTLVPDGKGKPATDSPRYKQLGNAVCVNVPEWLGCRIHAYDHGQLG
jgi:site-specific DNA-cytosine methylase